MIDAFLVGIAPQHVPAFLAALALPLLVLAVRRRFPVRTVAAGPPHEAALRTGSEPPSPVRQWAAWLLGISAAVHLALPLGHSDTALLTVGFLGSGAAFAWFALRAWEGRSWRLGSSLLVVATLVAYLVVAGSGQEEPDQVGIATALVELAALGLAFVPAREPGRPRRFVRFVGSTATVVATLLVGTTIWIGSFLAHSAPSTTDTNALAHDGDHAHEHDHAARAQAGIVMRPPGDHHVTAEQQLAADRLAAATKKAMARYASLDAARTAGYELPKPGTGSDVHLDNKAFKNDRRVLDPERPETLVFAIGEGRATLLGVVFVMEQAGARPPQPGGAITDWHAHNVCITALPPGFGIVSPFGSCPALSVNVTTPEMMHVWTVEDPPGGPFAEGLDKTWVEAYHAQHGVAFVSR